MKLSTDRILTTHTGSLPRPEELDDDRGRRVAVRSVLLIIAPGSPATIRTAAPITQILVRRNGSWTIARRTVGAPGSADGEPAA